MKIVTKKDFYLLPEGTLFANFQPDIFQNLCIKYQNLYNEGKEPVDFVYQSLIGNVEAKSSGDECDILSAAVHEGKPFKLDFNCGARDGMYDDEALYAIYEKEEIVDLIMKLEFCKQQF